ncbi:hypothetical protein [Nocardia cyriacigeorgica]|uniref:hypothetical protein n=1 Tax=Nocardia cyriacigeorgica TaxID=135487 RepID=UPI002456F661|nr:hypothetical protein [Nocardia cyriacigeorgica]
MTEAYDWSWLRAGIPQIDLDTYLAMPEDLAQAIEVKDGMPVHCESPSPNHIAVTDTIKQALRESARKRSPGVPSSRFSASTARANTWSPTPASAHTALSPSLSPTHST